MPSNAPGLSRRSVLKGMLVTAAGASVATRVSAADAAPALSLPVGAIRATSPLRRAVVGISPSHDTLSWAASYDGRAVIAPSALRPRTGVG